MIDDFLAIHANSLQLRARRTKILATNIANADTPNYKARDLAFAEVLHDARSSAIMPARGGNGLKMTAGGLHTTNKRHIASTQSTNNAQVMYRQPEQAALDGNTVDKDLEQARFAENNVRYQSSLKFINSRVSGLMRALRGE